MIFQLNLPRITSKLPSFSPSIQSSWTLRIFNSILASLIILLSRLTSSIWLLFIFSFHSYGYMTNTRIKFILVVDSLNSAFRENEIRTIFRNLHNEYVNFISNPFVVPNEQIFSKFVWSEFLIESIHKAKKFFFIFYFFLHRTFDRNIRSKIECYGAAKWTQQIII